MEHFLHLAQLHNLINRYVSTSETVDEKCIFQLTPLATGLELESNFMHYVEPGSPVHPEYWCIIVPLHAWPIQKVKGHVTMLPAASMLSSS